jgi:hypothetical protein
MRNIVREYGRKLLLFCAGTVIALGFLIIASIPSQHARQEEARKLLVAQQEAAAATRALACVLSLPVSEEGRSEVLAKYCFTQYGLEPPEIPGGD